jgi:hypothetical protein
MANDLAGYRTDLDNLLATAVDSSTWTTAIKDQALREALAEFNMQLVYETDFTVTAVCWRWRTPGWRGRTSLAVLCPGG